MAVEKLFKLFKITNVVFDPGFGENWSVFPRIWWSGASIPPDALHYGGVTFYSLIWVLDAYQKCSILHFLFLNLI